MRSEAAVAGVVRMPTAERPLPSPAQLRRILALPLVQLFVVGRSGSGLIHAFLDGHPGVLHVPHTFKYYDFVAANPDLDRLSPVAVAERFTASPLTQALFESARSVIIGGRLGDDQRAYVEIDRARFTEAFVSATAGQNTLSERTIFFGIVLAYGWCAGQNPDAARVVLHHVHHGDWLWPEQLIERANYHTPLAKRPEDILRADRFLLSVREPHDAMASVLRFVVTAGLNGQQRVDAQEQFVRLLLQDWLRLATVERSGCDVRVIRLEDLRTHAADVMRDCAKWLGIDAADESLSRLTYFGLVWHGDIFTTASTEVHRTSRPYRLSWQDRWLVDATVAEIAAGHGYGRPPTLVDRLLRSVRQLLSELWPSPSLRNTELSGWRAYKSALDAARARVQFVNQFRACA